MIAAAHPVGAKGFRPFFLLAGVWATLVVPLWIAVWTGHLPLRGVLQGVIWHGHEMIHGFTIAVIAGFLLTAVENWTRRPTLRGPMLLAAAATWGLARIGMLLPGWIGPVLDLAVLPLVVIGIARPLLATGNRRNLPLVGLLSVLWLTNLAVFLDAAGVWPGAAMPALRTSVYLIAVIVLVISGRVVPMFTRNATGDASVGNQPWLDRLAIGATVAVAAIQLFPGSPLLHPAAAVAGLAAVARMRRWWTPGVVERPLLWVLHLAHLALATGLLLLALQPLIGPVGSGPLHVITVGGIGGMTLGMMSRVSLGHTGRPIRVGRVMSAAFVVLTLSVLLRVGGPWLDPAHTIRWLWLSAWAWAVGFGVFVAVFAPILVSPRADGKPG